METEPVLRSSCEPADYVSHQTLFFFLNAQWYRQLFQHFAKSWRDGFIGKGQENTKVCKRQAHVESKWHSVVSNIATNSRWNNLDTPARKENQVKQKKKEEEEKAKAVRRVLILAFASNNEY